MMVPSSNEATGVSFAVNDQVKVMGVLPYRRQYLVIRSVDGEHAKVPFEALDLSVDVEDRWVGPLVFAL